MNKSDKEIESSVTSETIKTAVPSPITTPTFFFPLPERLRAAYKIYIPHLNISSDKNTPTFYEGKYYIRIGQEDYLVYFDEDNETWRIYSEENRAKPSLPIIYQDGQWQLHHNVGLAGGNPPNLPESLRLIYKVNLPALNEVVAQDGVIHHQDKYYVQIGEDHYWLNRTRDGGLVIRSQIDATASLIPVVYKDEQWQLVLRKLDINQAFSDFSEHKHFRHWVHIAVNGIALLASRHQAGSEKPTISVAQKQALFKFILKYFQMQGSYFLGDIVALGRQTSPLVTSLTYSRAKQTRLWEVIQFLRTAQLKKTFQLVQERAAQNRQITPNPQGIASQASRTSIIPLAEEFNIFPTSKPFPDKDGNMPDILDNVPLNLNEKRAVFIKSMEVQLIKASRLDLKSLERDEIDHDIGIRGLRMSQSEAADVLARDLTNMIQTGQVEGVRYLLSAYLNNKNHGVLSDGFKKIDLTPNTWVNVPDVDPLIQTGRAELDTLHAIYAQCRDFDKSRLPFYVKQNMAVLQNLIGSDPTRFFTEKTPALITAELIDRLQAAYDLMHNISREQGVVPVTHISSRMEQFYEVMQSLHHLVRFQLSWHGVTLNLEQTIKQLLPATFRDSAYVITGPHGMSVLDQVSRALSADFQKKAAILKGAYFETPELFPDAEIIESVNSPLLTLKKLILVEPHPNNAVFDSIIPHDPVLLLQNIFRDASSIRRTVVMDVTANHLTEVQIKNVLDVAKPYIDSGRLNLVLLQSGTKFFQNGMDTTAIGILVVLNNNQGVWSSFNEDINKTRRYVPADDKAYFARLLALDNIPSLQDYLNKIRQNTRTLRAQLEKVLALGHHNNNALELCSNTDPDTVYIAIKPTDKFIALQVKQSNVADIPYSERLDVNDILYEKYFLSAFKGLVNIERQSFGYNVTSFSQCEETIRLAVGIEDEALIDEYARRLVKLGEDLYRKGYIPDYFKDETSLGGEVTPPHRWRVVNLSELTDKVKKKPYQLIDGVTKKQIIVQLQDDEVSYLAAQHLFLKNPTQSKWVQWQTQASDIRTIEWDRTSQTVQSQSLHHIEEGPLRIVLVGHMTSTQEGQTIFGGKTLESLQQELTRLFSKMPAYKISTLKIDLLGCQLYDPVQPIEKSFSGKLALWAIEQGARLGIAKNNISIIMREAPIRVNELGKKEILTQQEWLNKEIARLNGIIHKRTFTFDPSTQKIIDVGPSLHELIEIHKEVDRDLYLSKMRSSVHRRENLAALRNIIGEKINQILIRQGVLVERIFQGQLVFHELSIDDQHLMLGFLKTSEIEALSQRSEDGKMLCWAMKNLVEKYTDPKVFSLADNTVVRALLDEDGDVWQALARKHNLPIDTEADLRIGAFIAEHLRQSGAKDVPIDTYTQQALGLRARVVNAFQTYIGYASKGVLALGAAAALCRINVIDARLASGKLTPEEEAKLRAEKGLAIAELGADLSDEMVGLIQSKLNISLTKPSLGVANLPTSSSSSSSLKLGTRITYGIRSFGLGATGTLLSAVGTGLAWYGVHTAAHELQALRASERTTTDAALKMQLRAQITQLRVNLEVNIATAIISSGLTAAGAVTFVASLAASLGLAGATSVAAVAGAFMSIAGPIGGVMLVGAFVGLWIYNGIKTVEEFSKHLSLTGWDKFELGFGSLFAWVPDHLQRQYNLQKLKGSVAEAAQLEARGVFATRPEVKETYALIFPEFPYRLNIDRVRNRDIDIDINKGKYLARSLHGFRERLDPSQFIHVRKTRDQLQASQMGYRHPAYLSLVKGGNVMHLPTSSWQRQAYSFIQSGKFLESMASGSVLSLRLEAQEQEKLSLNIGFYAATSTQAHPALSRHHHWTTQVALGTRLHAVLKVRLDGDDLDDLLVVLSDEVIALKGGKENFSSISFSHQQDTAILRGILNNQTKAKIFAINEAKHLTFFCLHEKTPTLSVFKYQKNERGDYRLDASFSLPSPMQTSWPDNELDTGVFFQDLNGDGLADLVVVHSDGRLQVARQKRDGAFVLTEEFSIYRAKTAEGKHEALSFATHKILGFGGTTRTLYSVDSEGAVYAHTVVSTAENKAQVSWINMNIAHGVDSYYGYLEGNPDKFVASSKPEAGEFIFRLGGGRDKKVTGSMNSDSFFILDDKTLCTVDGSGGDDLLDFSQLNLKEDVDIIGITLSAHSGKASLRQPSNPQTIYSQLERVTFSNIENYTGTSGNDVLKGDDKNNVIDGFGGEDTIEAGAGQDVLRGTSGTFNGGLGIDRYQFRRAPDNNRTPIHLIDDYSLGEDSYVSLDHTIDEIKCITPENGKHLLIALKTGGQYRLHDFYANPYAKSGQTSAWYFTTADGFRFRLETARASPVGVTALSQVSVSFQQSLTEESLGQAKINLYADHQGAGARVEIFEKVMGKENVRREIVLPALFKLELSHVGAQGTITGSHSAEYLTGSSGFRMKGNGGADTYLIEHSARGIVEIDNDDESPIPAQDTLILPWQLSKTRLSVQGNTLCLKEDNATGSTVEVHLLQFISSAKSRHISVRGLFGQSYHLDITDKGTAYLATGPLTLGQEDKLEVLRAFQGGLVLEGRHRDLSNGNDKSTVIVDQSGKGNYLGGTQNARNYLQVFDGNNTLCGGMLADELHGGLGNDYMQGEEGNDAYYVKGSATIQDTGGEDILVLLDSSGMTPEDLWFDRTPNGDLRIRFRSERNRVVTLQNDDQSDRKIEHIVMGSMCLSYGDIDYLVHVMSTMTAFADHATAQVHPFFTQAMSRWSSLVNSPSIAFL